MTNVYIFWNDVDDPPFPWTRLTRTNQYLRCITNTGNHWVTTGNTTHTHSVTGFSCGNCSNGGMNNYGSGNQGHAVHNHGSPSSWTINSGNNTPPGYGLDIIYINIDLFERLASFPVGSVILSNGELVDANLTRFSSADGKYIVHAEPGTTPGASSAHTHSVAGTTASNATGTGTRWNGSALMTLTSHNHAISLTSASTSPEPKNIVTRLYEAMSATSQAIAGAVVFVDGVVGSSWEVLTSWADSNIKSGDSNPTVSGSDTHTHSFSGNSGNNSAGSKTVHDDTEPGWSVALHPHTHSVSGTLASSSHVPSSKQVVPARLLATLYPKMRNNRVQIIGL